MRKTNIRDINPEWTDATLVTLVDAWAEANPSAGGSLISHLADVASSEEDFEAECEDDEDDDFEDDE